MSRQTIYKKYFAPLPPWGKAVALIGVGIAGYTVFNLVRGYLQQAGSRKSVAEFGEELDKLEGQGIYPTYTNAQYLAWANEIQEAFSGCDPFNLSSFTLIGILKNFRNDADFARLVTAFGVRSYPDCGWGTVAGDLYAAVNSELNVLDKGSCNKVLRDRGITYRF